MAMPTLHFGADRTTIADTELEVGWDIAGRDPSPLGLENAIAAIEDIALAAGVPAGAEMMLAVEAVEQVVQRLAARAPGLPAGREFAGKLVILRELMHHLEFESIVIRA